MGVLHLLCASPGASSALAQCLGRVRQGDALLLLEAGVYAGLQASVHSALLTEALPAGVACYALLPDLQARGIGQGELLPGIEVIDYSGFVALAVRHNPIVTWG